MQHYQPSSHLSIWGKVDSGKWGIKVEFAEKDGGARDVEANGRCSSNANYESFWFTNLGLVCSPWLAASNFQQFSESIDTVNWYRANTLLPTLCHVNKFGKSDNNMIWGFQLMTYNWLIFVVDLQSKAERRKHLNGKAKIHSPQHM